MEKISELTPEQKEYLPKFHDEWFDIGCCTDTINDRHAIEKAVSQMYKLLKKKKPKFIYCESPFSSVLCLNILQNADKYKVPQNTSHVKLKAFLQAAVKDLAKDYKSIPNLRSFLYANCWGQQESYWIAFYLFCEYIGVKYDKKDSDILHLWETLSKNCGWWWPYENYCVVSDRPEAIHWNKDKTMLHCETGPSVKFRDGWAIYSLNGVSVPEWLVETPAEKLDPATLATISNAEVRKEFVRKVGMERIVHKLSSGAIDKDDTYELHKFKIQDSEWMYLNMRNASCPEIWHTEGVPNNITTIQDALNYRNQLTKDQIDDDNGADWYQQGDVIIRPQGVKKFKSRPIVLT